MGKLLGHRECIKCDSSDALALYEQEDQSINGYCWSCKTRFTAQEIEQNKVLTTSKIKYAIPRETIESVLKLPISALTDRGIKEDIAKLYGVRVAFSESNNELEKHYYPITKNGEITGFKARIIKDKKFYSVGDIKGGDLFGFNIINSNKFLIVTEGECDTLAGKQMLRNLGKDYSICSILHSKSIKDNLEALSKFESIILMYDQDKVGIKQAKEDAKLLPPGKVKIARWDNYKDINDMLRANNNKLFMSAIYSAKEYRPDGIVRLSQAWDRLFENDSIKSIPYPWKGLNDKLYGLRPREIVTITAGSGVGKSAFCREIQHWLLPNIPEGDNIGILALEENIGRTAWGLMGIEANKPLHIREERYSYKKEDFEKYFNATVGTGRYVAYDHFGSTSSKNLISQIRYMINAMDCRWIFLDHLSIVVSDMDETGDERRTIDTIMTKLRQLTEETGANLINVVHLRRMSGDKGHERGGEVSLNQLRGSHSIAQLSDAVIALERDQQADDDFEANLTLQRVLKNRYAGYVGPANYLYYDAKTGRLKEVEDKIQFLEEMREAEF